MDEWPLPLPPVTPLTLSSDFLEWHRIASAPAWWYASALLYASSRP
eukprot:SAG25_NODE_944_length_4650_cov_9.607119_3_plen_46_part_00